VTLLDAGGASFARRATAVFVPADDSAHLALDRRV